MKKLTFNPRQTRFYESQVKDGKQVGYKPGQKFSLLLCSKIVLVTNFCKYSSRIKTNTVGKLAVVFFSKLDTRRALILLSISMVFL